MELALEAGAADFKAEPEGYEVLTEPATFEAVHRRIEGKGIPMVAAEVTWLPHLSVPLAGPDVPGVKRLIEAIEEHEDVKEVHTNADFPPPAS